MRKYILVLLSQIIILSGIQAQNWVEKFTSDGKYNFYEIQKEYNEWAKTADFSTARGWKQYKRWEWFMEPRVFPSGNLPAPNAAQVAMKKYYEENRFDFRSNRSSGNWKSLGPATASGKGVGRVNFITFHPTLPNTIFIGAPSGGLWRSDDGGSTWTTSTDSMEVIGFSDMVINPLNPKVMYLASSDGDASDTYSLGVLKSTDGGKTWKPTGLNWQVVNFRTIRKLLMHPTDTSVVYAATSAGLYRTDDGGKTWSAKVGGNFKDVEFKPGNPNVIYAGRYGYSGSSGFYRSEDGGNYFTKITSVFPASSGVRYEIAVTPDDTDRVYVVVANRPNTSSLEGFYVSNDAGQTFTKQSGTPNLLGRATNGTDYTVGQGWYDLDIIANPFDKNEVIVGGINIWKTTDGGQNWSLSAHWTGAGGAAYVHADIHALKFYPDNDSTFFVGCDGGIYKSSDNGNTYSDLSDGPVISQVYRLGLSRTNPELLLAGLQDNGTKRLSSGTWDDVNGGDGFECIIDYQDNNYMYASSQYGNIYRSDNGGNRFKWKKSGISETGGWLTPYVIDPQDPKTLYAGYVNVWKTTTRGDSWTKISDFSGTQTIDAIKVAPSNPNIIYFSKDNRIWRTSDGGTNWNEIALGLPKLSITYIEVHPTKPDSVWVTLSGYQNGDKVYFTPDGGNSWKNFSGGLPNLPANCIVYQKNTPDALYVGMDVGVYYRDNTLQKWIPFSTGLPNVIVNELEIYYDAVAAKQRLRAATYGRGIWESELFFSANMPPYADFSSADTHVCLGYTVRFQNRSAYADSFTWFFEGGQPSVSNETNPSVVYEMPGYHSVKFYAYNVNGVDSMIRDSFIYIDPLIDCIYIMPQDPEDDVYYSCTGRLYDPGGTNPYQNNLNTYISIAPLNTDKIALRFNQFNFEEGNDSLILYEGIGIKGKRLSAYSGNSLPNSGFMIVDAKSVTIRVKSNNSITRQGFEIDWHCIRNDEPPFVHLIPSQSTSCSGIIDFTGHIANNATSIKWKFGDGKTSSLQNPTHTYEENGSYTVWLYASNAFGTDSFKYSPIVIDIPASPTLEPVSLCSPGQATLKATGSNKIVWYADKEGTQQIHTGEELVVNVSKDTTFYVQGFESGTTQITGHSLGSATPGAFSSDHNGLVFDVLDDIVFKSFMIYAQSADTKKFAILDQNNDTVWTQSFSLGSKSRKVLVNITLQKGSDYKLVNVNTSGMWYSQNIATFPYKIDGLLSIKSNLSNNSNYYYFYDWEVAPLAVCSSRIVPIKADISDKSPDAAFTHIDSSFIIHFVNQSKDGFFFSWDFGDGQYSNEENPVHEFTNEGKYSVRLNVENGCGSDSVQTEINVVNSINNDDFDFGVLIYPNPNTGKFMIKDTGFGTKALRIYDMNGQLIHKLDKSINAQHELDLNLKPGLYLIRLYSDKGVIHKQVIVF